MLAMCADRKQILNWAIRIVAGALTVAGVAYAGDSGAGVSRVVIGERSAGITDRAYVMGPPDTLYVAEISPGSFLNCGERREARRTDADGRDLAEMTCGVTLTETVVIPAASTSASFTVHY